MEKRNEPLNGLSDIRRILKKRRFFMVRKGKTPVNVRIDDTRGAMPLDTQHRDAQSMDMYTGDSITQYAVA